MPKMKLQREEVYCILNSERAYQDKRWGASASSNEPGDGNRTIDEFALYISQYANALARLAATSIEPHDKLDFVRKVGALCVACMEQHGGRNRESE